MVGGGGVIVGPVVEFGLFHGGDGPRWVITGGPVADDAVPEFWPGFFAAEVVGNFVIGFGQGSVGDDLGEGFSGGVKVEEADRISGAAGKMAVGGEVRDGGGWWTGESGFEDIGFECCGEPEGQGGEGCGEDQEENELMFSAPGAERGVLTAAAALDQCGEGAEDDGGNAAE